MQYFVFWAFLFFHIHINIKEATVLTSAPKVRSHEACAKKKNPRFFFMLSLASWEAKKKEFRTEGVCTTVSLLLRENCTISGKSFFFYSPCTMLWPWIYVLLYKKQANSQRTKKIHRVLELGSWKYLCSKLRFFEKATKDLS